MKTVNVPPRLCKLENNPEHWALEQQGMCQTPRTSEEIILMFTMYRRYSSLISLFDRFS